MIYFKLFIWPTSYRAIYLIIFNFGIFISFENLKVIFAYTNFIHFRINLLRELIEKRQISTRKLSFIYLKLHAIIEVYNLCFGGCLLVDITRFFFHVISFFYFFALQFLWKMETELRSWSAGIIFRFLPLNFLTILIIFKCGSTKSHVSYFALFQF